MPLPTRFELANGMVMPAIGLGTFEANGDTSGVKNAIFYALSVGYRHFDTAFNYDNEILVGEAIRGSEIPREEIIITTKLSKCWHRPEDVHINVPELVLTMVTFVVDYYLMHWSHCYVVEGPNRERLTEDTPDGKRPIIGYQLSRDYVKVWKAMEALVDQRKARAIGSTTLLYCMYDDQVNKASGVSNFNVLKLEHLLKHTRIRPAFNQVELHPYLLQTELLTFCSMENIHRQAHQPLGGNPPAKSGSHHGIPGPMNDNKIKAIAKNKTTSPAQILLAWAVSRGTSAVPKSSRSEHINSNIILPELSKADLKTLDRLRKPQDQIRFLDPKEYLGFDIFNEEADEPIADEPPWNKKSKIEEGL
ncbi:hypothetical protein MMC18_001243 [Xylographa bjoerkii]|nr:hypothetical protein [Xylographa bjoerkii]